MEDFFHLLVPLAGCAMIFGIVYVAVSASNKENLAMIEAGMNPKGPKIRRHSKLRIALLAVTVPIGILIGNLVHDFFGMDHAPAAVVFGFLLGGIGLTTTYFIEEARDNNAG
jgi:uncharacterized PurR-regulated membrane protein YhhQ (DUF165 family)